MHACTGTLDHAAAWTLVDSCSHKPSPQPHGHATQQCTRLCAGRAAASDSYTRLAMTCPALTVPFISIHTWRNNNHDLLVNGLDQFFFTFGSQTALSSRVSDARYLQEEAAALQYSTCVYRTIIRTEFRNSTGGKWKKNAFLVVRLAFKKHLNDAHSPPLKKQDKKNLTFVLHNEWHALTHTVPYFSFYHSQPLPGQEGTIC